SQLGIPTLEVPVDYGRRPEGSRSKLRTGRDGIRILLTFARLLRETRPGLVFGLAAGVLAAAGLAIALATLAAWLATGLPPRFPTALAATGLVILAALSGACGLVLASVARARLKQKRML
ncbi:MAG TPA: glycosyl transferase, partial [Bauldia sp.]|nr:glycosyl transferase [Bauldia sp.]